MKLLSCGVNNRKMRLAARFSPVATAISLIVVILLGLSLGVLARARGRVRQAKAFCESIVPQIEAVRRQTGYYPTNADPSWWAGQVPPALIRTQDFYLKTGRGYLLRFKDPSAIMDDIWGLETGTNWYNYDGY